MVRWLLALIALAVVASACSSERPSLVATDESPAAGTTETPISDASPSLAPTPGADDQVEAGEATTQPAPATATAEPAAEATAEPRPTTEPAPTPAVTGGDGCTTAMAGAPVAQAEAGADLDGDGARDRVLVYSIDDGPNVVWRIRVETAAGESLDSPLGVEQGAQGIEPLGGADVDGDGATHELFTAVGSGASTRIVALHVRTGCDLVQATVGGGPARFPIGGSVGNIAGLECIDSDNNGVNNSLVAWTGAADFSGAEGDFTLDGVEYQLRGGELTEVGSRAASANLREADFVYAQLSCGGVNF